MNEGSERIFLMAVFVLTITTIIFLSRITEVAQ